MALASPALTAVLLALFVQPPQEERYREREVLDPSRDTWIPQAVPEGEVGLLPDARRLLVMGDGKAAEDLLEPWVEENLGDDRYYEGVYLLGESYFIQEEYWAAYEQFQTVSDNTAGELFFKALRREMDVARAFLSGSKRRVLKIFKLPAYDDGVEILDRIWERAPGTRLGEEAIKIKADYFFATGEMGLAQDEYVALVRDYPSGRYVPLAMLRSAEAAAAEFPGVEYTDAPLVEAEERYLQVQAAFPGYADREGVATRLDGIREQRAEKDLTVGQWYERIGQAAAAAYYYRLVLKEWPGTLAAGDAEVRLQSMGFSVEPGTE